MPETPQQFIDTPSLRMLRNVIGEHLNNRRPPLVVLGDEGSGKSTLLAKIANDFHTDFDCCLYQAHKLPSHKSSLHATIGHQWVKESPSSITTRTIFHTLCDAEPHRPPLLLIDDADLLSTAELSGVLNLKHAIDAMGKTRLGLILCGRSTLEPRIAKLNPDSGSQHIRLGLRPLTSKESEVFAHHLGYVLTTRQMVRLYRASNGLPGPLVNMLENARQRRERRFALPKLRFLFGMVALIGGFITAITLMHSHSTHQSRSQILALPRSHSVALSSARNHYFPAQKNLD